MYKLVVVGYGNMGQALVKGLVSRQILSAVDIAILDPSELAQKKAEKNKICVLTAVNNFTVTTETLLLAVKPQLITDVLPSLSGIQANLIMSIMAGIRIETIEHYFPSTPIARVMPNTPSIVGCGYSAYYRSEQAKEYDNKIETLLSSVGVVQQVNSEAELDKITALTGSGPGFIMEICRGYIDGAMAMGFDYATAKKMIVNLLQGSAAWLDASEEQPEELRKMVTSKGGTTAAGLQKMFDANIHNILLDTLQAAYQRAIELGEQ